MTGQPDWKRGKDPGRQAEKAEKRSLDAPHADKQDKLLDKTK
jgi:hypothetical protein